VGPDRLDVILYALEPFPALLEMIWENPAGPMRTTPDENPSEKGKKLFTYHLSS
jgi:hypothetical protein